MPVFFLPSIGKRPYQHSSSRTEGNAYPSLHEGYLFTLPVQSLFQTSGELRYEDMTSGKKLPKFSPVRETLNWLPKKFRATLHAKGPLMEKVT